jgi:hypothetical protein
MERVQRVERDWSAIAHLHVWPVIAGVLVALAVGVTLLIIGSAIGVTAARPNDTLMRGLGYGFVAWTLASFFTAGLLGSWVASLFARTPTVRDGLLHGVVVWSVLIVLSAGTIASALGIMIPFAGTIAPQRGRASMGDILGAWGMVLSLALPFVGALIGGAIGARHEVRHERALKDAAIASGRPTTDVHSDVEVPIT